MLLSLSQTGEFANSPSELLLEPYAVKVARTVLRRGKPARAYLFQLGELLAQKN